MSRPELRAFRAAYKAGKQHDINPDNDPRSIDEALNSKDAK